MLLLWRFLPVSATQFQWIGLCGHHFASIMRKVLSGHWCNSVLNWRKEKKVPCSGSNQKMHKLITGPNVYIFMAIWKQYLWREAVEIIKRSIVWIANHLTDRLIFKGPLSETFPWIEISIVALILFYRHGSPGNVNTANNKFKRLNSRSKMLCHPQSSCRTRVKKFSQLYKLLFWRLSNCRIQYLKHNVIMNYCSDLSV